MANLTLKNNPWDDGVRVVGLQDIVHEFVSVSEAINYGWTIPPKKIELLVRHIKFDIDACDGGWRGRKTLEKMLSFLKEKGYVE